MTFRRWERSIGAEHIHLSEGEKSLIGQLLMDFLETLDEAKKACGRNGLLDLLCDEYEDRMIWR